MEPERIQKLRTESLGESEVNEEAEFYTSEYWRGRATHILQSSAEGHT